MSNETTEAHVGEVEVVDHHRVVHHAQTQPDDPTVFHEADF